MHASQITPKQLMQAQGLKLCSGLSSASLCLRKLSDSTHKQNMKSRYHLEWRVALFNGLASNSIPLAGS